MYETHYIFQNRTPHLNVHFAGTATSVEWCGYFSGAVQSGYRAVAEVLQVCIHFHQIDRLAELICIFYKTL